MHTSSSLSTLTQKVAAILTLALMLPPTDALPRAQSGAPPKSRAPNSNAPSPKVQPTGSMTQMPLVAPLFIQDRDFASTLVMVNASAEPAVADVVLSNLDGLEITHKSVSFTGHSQRRVDILELLAAVVSPATTGKVTVMQNPAPKGSSILASLSLTYLGSEQPSYIDEELAMPSAQGSQTLRAVADPGEGSPLIAITNLSESGQRVTIQCFTETGKPFSKTVDLLKNETLLTEACSDRTLHGAGLSSISSMDSEGPHGPVGISLTTDGTPGSFAAFGLVRHQKESNQFLTAVPFTDPQTLLSSTTIFAGVPVGTASLLSTGNYVPELSVTNFSAKDVQVHVGYSQTSAETPNAKDLAAFTLAAGRSKRITFDNLQGDPQLQNSFLVTSTGAPGDMLAKLVSKDDSAPYEVELLGKDAEDLNNGGSHPWSLEQGTESTLLLFNHSAEAQPFSVAISDGAGNLWLKTYELKPMQTASIRMREIVQDQLKDGNGKTLPRSTTTGQVSWFTRGPGNGKGRLLQSNLASAMARNFSCNAGHVLCGAHFSPGTTLLTYGTTVTFGTLLGVLCYNPYPGTGCTGPADFMGDNGYTYQWYTSNSSIISFPGATTSPSVNVYGQGVGSTAVQAYVYDPVDNCGPYVDGNTGTVIAPSATITVKFSGSKSSGDNLNFGAASCSENLGGPLVCNNASVPGWFWNVEVSGVVNDDASKWTVTQTIESKRAKGYYKDSQGALHAFDTGVTSVPCPPCDGPDSRYLQQTSGQKNIFYLDGPGPFMTYSTYGPVDSETFASNFTAHFCSTTLANTCYTQQWYVKIVVDPGAFLDVGQSSAGSGTTSTNF